MRRADRRRGFTIIELMAALALAGILIVSIALLVRQIGVTQDSIRRTSVRADADGTGALLLRTLLDAVEATSDTTRQFAGDASFVSLATSCDQPGGWRESCDATLALDRRGDTTVVLGAWRGHSDVRLLAAPGTRSFIFLESTASGRWLNTWGRGSLPPAAIGLVDQLGDTLIYSIGDRS